MKRVVYKQNKVISEEIYNSYVEISTVFHRTAKIFRKWESKIARCIFDFYMYVAISFFVYLRWKKCMITILGLLLLDLGELGTNNWLGFL